MEKHNQQKQNKATLDKQYQSRKKRRVFVSLFFSPKPLYVTELRLWPGLIQPNPAPNLLESSLSSSLQPILVCSARWRGHFYVVCDAPTHTHVHGGRGRTGRPINPQRSSQPTAMWSLRLRPPSSPNDGQFKFPARLENVHPV